MRQETIHKSPRTGVELKDLSPTLSRTAWINDSRQVILFHREQGTRPYREAERPFWQYLTALVERGYRIG